MAKKVKVDANDVLEVAPDVVEIVGVLVRTLKKDEDGKVRVTRDEAKELMKAAKNLTLSLIVALAKP